MKQRISKRRTMLIKKMLIATAICLPLAGCGGGGGNGPPSQLGYGRGHDLGGIIEEGNKRQIVTDAELEAIKAETRDFLSANNIKDDDGTLKAGFTEAIRRGLNSPDANERRGTQELLSQLDKFEQSRQDIRNSEDLYDNLKEVEREIEKLHLHHPFSPDAMPKALKSKLLNRLGDMEKGYLKKFGEKLITEEQREQIEGYRKENL